MAASNVGAMPEVLSLIFENVAKNSFDNFHEADSLTIRTQPPSMLARRTLFRCLLTSRTWFEYASEVLWAYNPPLRAFRNVNDRMEKGLFFTSLVACLPS